MDTLFNCSLRVLSNVSCQLCDEDIARCLHVSQVSYIMHLVDEDIYGVCFVAIPI